MGQDLSVRLLLTSLAEKNMMLARPLEGRAEGIVGRAAQQVPARLLFPATGRTSITSGQNPPQASPPSNGHGRASLPAVKNEVNVPFQRAGTPGEGDGQIQGRPTLLYDRNGAELVRAGESERPLAGHEGIKATDSSPAGGAAQGRAAREAGTRAPRFFDGWPGRAEGRPSPWGRPAAGGEQPRKDQMGGPPGRGTTGRRGSVADPAGGRGDESAGSARGGMESRAVARAARDGSSARIAGGKAPSDRPGGPAGSHPSRSVEPAGSREAASTGAASRGRRSDTGFDRDTVSLSGPRSREAGAAPGARRAAQAGGRPGREGGLARKNAAAPRAAFTQEAPSRLPSSFRSARNDSAAWQVSTQQEPRPKDGALSRLLNRLREIFSPGPNRESQVFQVRVRPRMPARADMPLSNQQAARADALSPSAGGDGEESRSPVTAVGGRPVDWSPAARDASGSALGPTGAESLVAGGGHPEGRRNAWWGRGGPLSPLAVGLVSYLASFFTMFTGRPLLARGELPAPARRIVLSAMAVVMGAAALALAILILYAVFFVRLA